MGYLSKIINLRIKDKNLKIFIKILFVLLYINNIDILSPSLIIKLK